MKSLFLFVLYGFVFSLSARQWPDSMEEVIGGFGSPINYRFERGIRFNQGKRSVSAWNNAVVRWASDGEYSDLIPDNASLLVMQDDDDFRAFYKGIRTRPGIPIELKQATTIGRTQDTESWVMEIFDMRSKRVIDPMVLLPDRINLPSPEVEEVIFSRAGQRLRVTDGSDVPRGVWNVIFRFVLPDGGYLTPKNSSLYWLGNRLSTIKFDRLTEEDYKIVMESDEIKEYASVYDSEGNLYFEGIVFGTGVKDIELHLRDELDRLIIHPFSLRFY